MPKKKRLTEPEVYALIVKEAEFRIGCRQPLGIRGFAVSLALLCGKGMSQ